MVNRKEDKTVKRCQRVALCQKYRPFIMQNKVTQSFCAHGFLGSTYAGLDAAGGSCGASGADGRGVTPSDLTPWAGRLRMRN